MEEEPQDVPVVVSVLKCGSAPSGAVSDYVR